MYLLTLFVLLVCTATRMVLASMKLPVLVVIIIHTLQLEAPVSEQLAIPVMLVTTVLWAQYNSMFVLQVTIVQVILLYLFNVELGITTHYLVLVRSDLALHVLPASIV